MKLRLKLIILLSMLVLALISTLIIFSYTTILGRYLLIEQQEVNQEMQRVNNILANEVERIDALNLDWASWDDTYAFATDLNPDYIRSNLHTSTFATNRVNMMLLYDTSGSLLIGRAYDIEEEAQVDVPAFLRGDISGLGLLTEGVDDARHGVVSIPEGVLMLSSRPILTTTDEGPSRGTLVMGRFIDEQELLRIAELMDLTLEARRIDGEPLPADYQTAYNSITAEDPVAGIPVDASTISGYAVLTDYIGQPAMLLRISIPRGIYQEGLMAVQIFIVYFLFIGAAVGVAGLIVNDYLFVRPITALSERVEEIGRRKDFDERIEVKGDDERASLARDINGMLDSLKESRESELARRTEVEGMRREHFKELLLGASKVINSVRFDLRSPLQVIRNATYLLREDPGRAEALTDMIDESVETAITTIEDLSSKTQTGELKITVTDLRYVIEMAAEMAKIPPEVKVETRCSDEFLAILLDVAKFQRVLDNLIRNAVEAMPSGGTLTISSQRLGDTIQVIVQDTGAGISKEDMSKLFQPFFTTKQGGTGLGLVSSKATVEALGGQIMVESTLDVGTKVTVSLPNRSG